MGYNTNNNNAGIDESKIALAICQQERSRRKKDMALIKCPECGTEVSDKAAACPRCAYPLQQAQAAQVVEMAFDKVSGQIFNTGCAVYDMSGNELASCRQGDTISFKCTKPMQVQVKVSGSFGKPTVNVEPGGLYQVSISGMGKVTVQKVSRLREPTKAGYWGSR